MKDKRGPIGEVRFIALPLKKQLMYSSGLVRAICVRKLLVKNACIVLYGAGVAEKS
jgi:hypothetical protein